MMLRLLLFTVCALALLVPVHAEESLSASERLEVRLQEARKALATSEERILQQRTQALAEIQALNNAIRAREAELSAVAELRSEKRRRLEAQTAKREAQAASIRRLARRLAGEGLAVAANAGAADLMQQWDSIRDGLFARIEDLKAAVAIRKESGEVMDRAGNPVTVPLWHWGATHRLALGETPESRGFCRLLDDGSWQVWGPYLRDEDKLSSSAAWVDVSGRLALSAPKATGILAFINRAGPFAWPILALAVFGLVIIADRVWLMWSWRLPQSSVDRLISDVSGADAKIGEESSIYLAKSKAPTTKILKVVLEADKEAPNSSQEAHEQKAGAALVEAEVRLQRGLRILAVLAATAPLLGLLGTVTGMIKSFRALNIGVGGADASLLSAGIGEALLTTELGLIVAVPLLLAHAVFARDAQRRRAHAESAAMRLLAVQQRGGATADA